MGASGPRLSSIRGLMSGRGRAVVAITGVAALAAACLGVGAYWRHRGSSSPSSATIPGQDVPGCNRPHLLVKQGDPGELAPIILNLPRASGIIQPSTATAIAKEMEARERIYDCMMLIDALEPANPGLPAVQCIDTIDVCVNPAGDAGCCPRGCIDAYKKLCAGMPAGSEALDRYLLNLWQCDPAEIEAYLAKLEESKVPRPPYRKGWFFHAVPGGAVFQGSDGSLLRSRDDGRSWRPIDAGLEKRVIYGVGSTSRGRLYALSQDSLFRWDEAQARWAVVAAGPDAKSASYLELTVDGSGRLFVVVKDATMSPLPTLWTSNDEGKSWEDLKLPVAWRSNFGEATVVREGELLVSRQAAPVFVSWRAERGWKEIGTDPRITGIQRTWPLSEGRVMVLSGSPFLVELEARALKMRESSPTDTLNPGNSISQVWSVVEAKGQVFTLATLQPRTRREAGRPGSFV